MVLEEHLDKMEPNTRLAEEEARTVRVEVGFGERQLSVEAGASKRREDRCVLVLSVTRLWLPEAHKATFAHTVTHTVQLEAEVRQRTQPTLPPLSLSPLLDAPPPPTTRHVRVPHDACAGGGG